MGLLSPRRRFAAVALPVLVAAALATALSVPGVAIDRVPVPTRVHVDTVRPAAAPANPYVAGEAGFGRQVAGAAATANFINAVLVNQFADAVRQNQFLDAAQRLLAQRAAAGSRTSGGAPSGGSGRCNGDVACFLACTRAHESDSGGGYAAVGGGGRYRGAYQFDQQTWNSNAAASGRTDLVGQDPAAVAPAVQDQVAADTYARRGSQPWGGRC
jgi:hypothetical protein